MVDRKLIVNMGVEAYKNGLRLKDNPFKGNPDPLKEPAWRYDNMIIERRWQQDLWSLGWLLEDVNSFARMVEKEHSLADSDPSDYYGVVYEER